MTIASLDFQHFRGRVFFKAISVQRCIESNEMFATHWGASNWLGFEPPGWDLSLQAQILSLQAGIWGSRLGFQPSGWDLSFNAGI